MPKKNIDSVAHESLTTKPAQDTQINLHRYDKTGKQTIEPYSYKKSAQFLESKQDIWIDICGLKNKEEIKKLCKDFSINPFIIEDILNTKQRPKLESTKEGFFIICKILDDSSSGLSYSSEQFSMIVKKNFLLTIRESDSCNLHSFYKKVGEPNDKLVEHGYHFLAYMLLDRIVDNYFHFVDNCETKLKEIENLLIKKPNAINLSTIYTIKRRLMSLRKVISPLKDLIHLLLTEHGNLIEKNYHLYYHNLYDHTARLIESIDLQREMISSILEIYLSTQNNILNETMKILTIFASLFIPLSFIAGIYGMNFKYMPELNWHYSYPIVLLVMLIVAISMLFYFKHKKLF